MIHSHTTAGLWLNPEVGPALEAIALAIQEASTALPEDGSGGLAQVLTAQGDSLRTLSGVLEVAGIRSGGVVLGLAADAVANVSSTEDVVELVELVLWSVIHVGNLVEGLARGGQDDPSQSLPVIGALLFKLDRPDMSAWELFAIPPATLPDGVVPPPGSLRFGLGAELAWVLPRIVVATSEMPTLANFVPGLSGELSRMTNFAKLAAMAEHPVPDSMVQQTLSDLRRILFGLADALRAVEDGRPDANGIAGLSGWPASLQEVVASFGLEYALPRLAEREFSAKVQAGLNSSVVLATTNAASVFMMEVADRIQLNQAVANDEAAIILATLDFLGIDAADVQEWLPSASSPEAARRLADLSKLVEGLALSALTYRSLPTAAEKARDRVEDVLVEMGGVKSEVQSAVEAAGDLESLPASLGSVQAARLDRISSMLASVGLGPMSPYAAKLGEWILALSASPSIQLSELRPWAQALGELEYTIELLRDGARACSGTLLSTRKTMASAGFDPELGMPMELPDFLTQKTETVFPAQPLQETAPSKIHAEHELELAAENVELTPVVASSAEDLPVAEPAGWSIQLDNSHEVARELEPVPEFDFEVDAIRERVSASPEEAPAVPPAEEWGMEELPLPDLQLELKDPPPTHSPDLPAHIRNLVVSPLPSPSGPVEVEVEGQVPKMAPISRIPVLDEPALSHQQEEVKVSGSEFTPVLVVPFDAPTSVNVDVDMQEVFGEEITEELASLSEWIPDLFSVPPDQDVIYNIRKSFHTIKGSGRMVGAATLGEMAWAVESVLNRVMEKRQPLSDSIISLVIHAHGMVGQFHKSLSGEPASWGPRELIDWANELQRGNDIPSPFPAGVDWSALAADLAGSATSPAGVEQESVPELVAPDLSVIAPVEGAVITPLPQRTLEPSVDHLSDSTVDDVSPVTFDMPYSQGAELPVSEAATVVLDLLPQEDRQAPVDLSWDVAPGEVLEISTDQVVADIEFAAIPEPQPQPVVVSPELGVPGLSLVPIEDEAPEEVFAPLSPARGFGGTPVQPPPPTIEPAAEPSPTVVPPAPVSPTPAPVPRHQPVERVVRPLTQDLILQGTDWKVLLANAQDQAIAARAAMEAGDVNRALDCIDRQVPALDRLAELVLILERASKLAAKINRENGDSSRPAAIRQDPASPASPPPVPVQEPAPSPRPAPPPRKKEPVAVIPEPPVSFWRRWFWFGDKKKK